MIMSGEDRPKGGFVVISSPSGGGKTTLIKRLLESNHDLVYSVSATTRPKRSGEENGRSYWFYSVEEFRSQIDSGYLLEWEEVHGDFYGTPKEFALNAVTTGKIVLFDLDVKGALKLKQKLPDTILIFLRPPSMEILEHRLRKRNTESEARISRRLQNSKQEMAAAEKFDYIVINDDLKETVKRIEEIIHNHHPDGV